jgi:hydroxymethylpyrimidine pyrophosphatase-like HAD family hydrolase
MPRFDLVRCISTENAYYISGEYANDHWSIGKKETIITDFHNFVGNDAFYIDGNTNKSQQVLTEHLSDIRTVTYSDVNIVTIVHREATKLNALNVVKDTFNIEINDIAIFGDDYSDVEMLSNGINSIAVANAIHECKAVAKYICDSNENDGVAKWIEENIL